MALLDWIAGRKATFVSIAVGTMTWGIAFALCMKLWPAGPTLLTASERVAYAAELLVAVAAVVLMMISACFRVFDTAGAEDPFANVESAGWRVHQRVLQNTIEQGFVFAPALLGLAARLRPDQSRVLVILTALWCAGRLLFWVGYRASWRLRGPGFEWTLFSSATALVWFVTTL